MFELFRNDFNHRINCVDETRHKSDAVAVKLKYQNIYHYLLCKRAAIYIHLTINSI